MREKKKAHKRFSIGRNKGTTEAASQLECFTCDFPIPGCSDLAPHLSTHIPAWGGQALLKSYSSCPQSKSKTLKKHRSGSVSMPMSAL